MRFLSPLAVTSVALLAAACGGGGDGGSGAVTPLPGIYVHAANGSDLTGDGSPEHPFKTIKRGSQGAGFGDVVRVGPGTYDVANGERFPIIPGFGLTIIGTEVRTVESTVRLTSVVGGGLWSGDPDGRLHATIIPNDGDHIVGLRITNPEPAALGGAKPTAILLAFSGATVESCALVDSDRGVRTNGTVSNSLLKNCALARNGIGIFVDGAGANNRVENCTLIANGVGVMSFSGGLDFGGGPAASAGHNAFTGSASNDFVHFTGTTETIFARDCFWDHAPPTLTVGQPAPMPDADIWVVGSGDVSTQGAQLYVPPGTAAPPPGGGTASP